MPDLATTIERDRRAVRASLDALASWDPARADPPTPCTGWTLADLVAHMTVQQHGFARAFDGDPTVLDDWAPVRRPDPVAAYRESCDVVLAALDRLTDPDAPVLPEVRDEPLPAATVVGFHLVDNAVHAWDAARALGRETRLDDDVVATEPRRSSGEAAAPRSPSPAPCRTVTGAATRARRSTIACRCRPVPTRGRRPCCCSAATRAGPLRTPDSRREARDGSPEIDFSRWCASRRGSGRAAPSAASVLRLAGAAGSRAVDLQLSGRVVLVTGGSRGIGRAIVDGLAAEGARVAFCARGADGVEAAEADLRASGADVVGTAVDVADGDAVRTWVGQSAEHFGAIDAVVANVSALAIGPGEQNWRSSFEVDLMHTVALVEAARPHLERSDAASVTAVSSVSGREIDFADGSYGVMKAALVHYVSGLAFDLAGTGIRANAVSPGNVYFDGGVWQNVEQSNTELFDHAMGLNPTGRMGNPTETAYAVIMLVSPLASRISGTNLVVDGALTRGVQL